MEKPTMKENFGRGPTTGNQASRKTKRSEFKAAKEERSGLADSIHAAYGARAGNDKVEAKLESIRDTVKPKKFSR
jgi:hypothetical protein